MQKNSELDRKRPLTDIELQYIVEESDKSDREEDKVQQDPFNSDDSVADSDYVPDGLDEELYQAELANALKPKRKGVCSDSGEQFRNKQCKLSEPSTSREALSEEETIEDVSVSSNYPTFVGRNRHVWKGAPVKKPGGKTPAKNILYIRPGPTNRAQNVIEPIDIFSLFFTEEILSEILVHTNEKIAKLREKYKVKTATVSDTTMTELRSLLGLSEKGTILLQFSTSGLVW